MATMANVSMLNFAGTAITGTALQPSAGDKTPARWRIETANPPILRPIISMVVRPNSDGSVRTVDIKLVKPYVYTDVATGLPTSTSRCSMSASFVVPQGIATADVDDFYTYCRTLLADALIVISVRNQIAPT